MCASGFDELLAFSASCWLWKQPAKSWVASRSGSCLARGQVNVVDEAKLLSPVCSTFEALVVQCVFRHCSRELGPFCWPILATDVVVFGASHRLTEHSSQMWWFHQDSESCVGEKKKSCVDPIGSRPPHSDHDLFWCKFGFGKCLSASRSNHWAHHYRLLYKIHFSSHVTIRLWNGSLFLHRIREDDTSKWFFYLQSAHESPSYRAFSLFQFALNANQS